MTKELKLKENVSPTKVIVEVDREVEGEITEVFAFTACHEENGTMVIDQTGKLLNFCTPKQSPIKNYIKQLKRHFNCPVVYE